MIDNSDEMVNQTEALQVELVVGTHAAEVLDGLYGTRGGHYGVCCGQV